MKKVAVICAAGKQGKLLVNEAVSRGYEVTGFVRGSDKVENAKAKTVVKDLFDLARAKISSGSMSLSTHLAHGLPKRFLSTRRRSNIFAIF